MERIYKTGKYENSNRKRLKEGRGKKGERKGALLEERIARGRECEERL